MCLEVYVTVFFLSIPKKYYNSIPPPPQLGYFFIVAPNPV